MTGDIKVEDVAANTNVAFKNCAPFTRWVIDVNGEHDETAENLDIIMPMYILIEYSDNYTDSSGSLYQFKRDESPMNDAGNHLNFALENSTSFKYKANLLEKATDDGGNNRSLKNAEIVVPLKYLSNFFRSLEIPNNRETIFKITSKELYLPIVVLSTKDDVNLTKQLNEGFKRSVY